MSDTNLTSLHARVWNLIGAATGTPMPLATSRIGEGASLRMVVLRRVIADSNILEFWTHAASAKLYEIAADPTGEVLIWDDASQTQARLRVNLSVSSGDPEDWATMGKGSRLNYAGPPLPGDPLATPDAASHIPDPALFKRLTAQVTAMDVLVLAPLPQRRAKFGPDGEGAQWVAP